MTLHLFNVLPADKRPLVLAHRLDQRGLVLWCGQVALLLFTQTLTLLLILAETYWAAAALVFVIAFILHSLLMSFHEAVHRTLSPWPWANELAGHAVAVCHFNSLTLFRGVHRLHHERLATADDVELWPFADPSAPRWLRRLCAAVQLPLGLYYEAFLYWSAFMRSRIPIATPGRVYGELCVMMATWVALVSCVASYAAWDAFLWLWLVPLTVCGQFHVLRKWIEHLGCTGTRTVLPDPGTERRMMGFQCNIGHHDAHHRYPRVPGYNLPALSENSYREMIQRDNVHWSYGSAFLQMVRGLSDPKVER